MKTREELLAYIDTVGLGSPAEVRRFLCPQCFDSWTQILYTLEPKLRLECKCGFVGVFVRDSGLVLDESLRRSFPESKLIFGLHPAWNIEGL